MKQQKTHRISRDRRIFEFTRFERSGEREGDRQRSTSPAAMNWKLTNLLRDRCCTARWIEVQVTPRPNCHQPTQFASNFSCLKAFFSLESNLNARNYYSGYTPSRCSCTLVDHKESLVSEVEEETVDSLGWMMAWEDRTPFRSSLMSSYSSARTRRCHNGPTR